MVAGAVALALVLGVSGAQFTRTNYTVDGFAPAIALLLALAFSAWQTLPVVLAAFRPVVAWLVFASSCVVPLVVVPIDPSEPWPLLPTALLAYLVVQFALARTHRLVVAVPLWLLAAVSNLLVASTGPPTREPEDDVTLFTLLSALALVVGTAARIWAQSRTRLAAEELLTADERSRRVLLEERARIAREMHDIVAHHMSMVAVQASTAEFRIEGLTPAAKEEFEAIGRTARESLTEMRRLLRVLRNEEDAGATAPQPGLGDLAPLVAATRRAGTPVTLTLADLPADPPELVALTAYRIVQEALSNVVRHSAGARTEVRVQPADQALVVVIANDAAPDAVPVPSARLEPPRVGHGLAGMRERVDLVGGQLVSGPRDGGGFCVTATLPVLPQAPASAPARTDGERRP